MDIAKVYGCTSLFTCLNNCLTNFIMVIMRNGDVSEYKRIVLITMNTKYLKITFRLMSTDRTIEYFSCRDSTREETVTILYMIMFEIN